MGLGLIVFKKPPNGRQLHPFLRLTTQLTTHGSSTLKSHLHHLLIFVSLISDHLFVVSYRSSHNRHLTKVKITT
ncbi:hypothetical protein L1987_32987 [Smallanthus sonchifolius]|uniref:Uncharacterized protein n=1 Tax=Smallanthus sonchifolius TaxID=185202 RepID=A0ACB9HPA3_9ASTR|nr:hypothetical protein L1987_32987 [Smallanthus sonchifolius]